MTASASMEAFRRMMEGTITEEEKKENQAAEARRAKLERGSEEHAVGLRERDEKDEKRWAELAAAAEKKEKENKKAITAQIVEGEEKKVERKKKLADDEGVAVERKVEKAMRSATISESDAGSKRKLRREREDELEEGKKAKKAKKEADAEFGEGFGDLAVTKPEEE